MIKRTVEISTRGCFVHAEHCQIVIEKDGEKLGSVPIEDLGVLIIDSDITITSNLISELADANVALIFTDEKHLPASLTIPFVANSIQSKILNHQISVSVPNKKRLWASVVSAKILNQSDNLQACGKDGTSLREISKNVPSGDPKNLEAFAARIYWRKLFGDDFRRNRENPDANMLLNYGYAIIRASVARAIVGTGLHPSFGIHHKNQYNPFPLADDLMEPIRPFVDRKVFSIMEKFAKKHSENDGEIELELNRETKAELLSLLAEDCFLDNRKQPILVAIGLYVASIKQIITGETKKPLIPTL
jgi:CRISP-associated protein Cas1